MKPSHIIVHDRGQTECALTIWADTSWETDKAKYLVNHSDMMKDNEEKICKDISLVVAPIAHGYNLSFGNTLLQTGIYTVLYRSRLPKPYQGLYINSIAEKKKDLLPHLKPIKTWRSHKSGTGIDGKVIIRPQLGACSIGLIVLDTKVTSIGSVNRLIIEGDFQAGATPTSTNLTIKKKFEELPGSPVYCSEGDTVPLQGMTLLKERYFIQEYVDNIKTEYRIIIGADNRPVYAIQRERYVYGQLDGTDLAYGRSKAVGVGNSFPTLREAGIPDYVEEEFNHLLQSADFALHSFDLFLTDDGQWGVFEFSNEYGVESVPHDLTIQEARTYIENIIERVSM